MFDGDGHPFWRKFGELHSCKTSSPASQSHRLTETPEIDFPVPVMISAAIQPTCKNNGSVSDSVVRTGRDLPVTLAP